MFFIQVTLSMSYSSSVTSHNSRVFTDDIQRLSGRKEQLTREKAFKVEERLATQRRRRQHLATERIIAMQRATRRQLQEHRPSDLDIRKTPCLLVSERANERQDRIRTRTCASASQPNTIVETYMSLNKDC